MSTHMPRFVALLRAINTPPRHVKMDRLRSIFEALGCDDVATFIASGNVIFNTAPEGDLVSRIETALEADLGFPVPVFLRTATEVVAAADCRPFGDVEGSVEISFLPDGPDPDRVRELLDGVTGNDRLAVVGREVHWLRHGSRAESEHNEGRVVRTLGMLTTRRSAQTVRAIADRFLR